jgi:hypothetical protein
MNSLHCMNPNWWCLYRTWRLPISNEKTEVISLFCNIHEKKWSFSCSIISRQDKARCQKSKGESCRSRRGAQFSLWFVTQILKIAEIFDKYRKSNPVLGTRAWISPIPRSNYGFAMFLEYLCFQDLDSTTKWKLLTLSTSATCTLDFWERTASNSTKWKLGFCSVFMLIISLWWFIWRLILGQI